MDLQVSFQVDPVLVSWKCLDQPEFAADISDSWHVLELALVIIDGYLVASVFFDFRDYFLAAVTTILNPLFFLKEQYDKLLGLGLHELVDGLNYSFELSEVDIAMVEG